MDDPSDTPLRGARRALLVGVDRYPHLLPHQQLYGAVADVDGMAEVLERRFEFGADDLYLLRDCEATRDNVLGRLDVLIEASNAGDLLVLHWSGHGSQCPAGVGPQHVDEPDGLAETLVPHDSGRPDSGRSDSGRSDSGRSDSGRTDWRRTDQNASRDIADDEIRLRLATLDLHGVFVTLIFDCCHSGHVYRAAGPRVRAVEAADGRPFAPPSWLDARARPSLRGGGTRQAMPRQVVLAACRDEERASERPIPVDSGAEGWENAPAHGHFTWSLLCELRRHEPAGTAGEVFRRARARMLAENASQTPQLAGADERLLFGVEARVARPWVRVGRLRGAAAGEDEECEECEEGQGSDRAQIELAAGANVGIEAGSAWSIHRAGTERPEDAERLALAEVSRVDAFRSHAKLTCGRPSRVCPDDRAFLLRAARGEARLPVSLDLLVGVLELREKKLVEASPYLRTVVGGAALPDLVHVVPAGPGPRQAAASERFPGLAALGPLIDQAFVLCDARGEPFDVLAHPDGVDALRRRLERRARHRQGLRVENPDEQSAPKGLVLRLIDPESGEALNPATDPNELPCFHHGDRLAFEVSHDHTLPLFLTVLDFDVTDGVSQLFPLPGAEEALDPGRTLRVGLAEGDKIALVLTPDFDPKPAPHWRRDSSVEFLKLFATSAHTDCRMLCTDDTETGGRDEPPTVHRGGSLASWLDIRSPAVTRSNGDVWGVSQVAFRLARRR